MIRALIFALCLLGLCSGAKANPRSIPPSAFPAPFGVNIHFTKGQPGEMAMLAKAFRVARMDFFWHATERERGVYDFSAYDGLMVELDAHGVTPLFILDYGNDVYQQGPPRSPEAVAAYARWAAAAAKHYKGRKIMWEFWNEPNLSGFWGNLPPNADEYANIVLKAGAAMRQADPECTLLVGATSGFPWDFIETAMGRGVLRYADAFTVHPYRSGLPETVAPDYAQLRRMLHKHSPDREIPIISGEWGYSTNTKTGISEERQAQYLVRQRLLNAAQGIRTSIWYDWKNDGPDPEENEHRFGTVTEDMKPKPSYTAARVMTETLSGYRFARNLGEKTGKNVLLLRNGKGETALALWTTGPEARYTLPDAATVVSMSGERHRASAGDRISFGPSPVYVLLGKSKAMDVRAMWWWMRPHTVVTAGKRIQTPGLTVVNTTSEPRNYTVNVKVNGGSIAPGLPTSLTIGPGARKTVPVAIRVQSRIPETRLYASVRSSSPGGEAVTDEAWIPLTISNPLGIAAGPVNEGNAEVTVTSFTGEPEDLFVALRNTSGLEAARPVVAKIAPGRNQVLARVPVTGVGSVYSYGVVVQDQRGTYTHASPVRFHPILDMRDSTPGEMPRGLAMHAEGDDKVGGSASLTAQRDPERGIVADLRAEYPDGWRYFVVTPEETAIPLGAVAVGMWVNGDGSGDALRCRFLDAKGQMYQSTYGHIDWKGWRWITMRLDDPSVGSWGGPQDGVIHHPMQWDSIFLLDSGIQKAHTAHIQFTGVTVISSASGD